MPAAWSEATETLIQEVYPELREMAARLMRREREDHTLQRTALVHEALIRLFGKGPDHAPSPGSFLAFAAHQMRQILVDHARRHRSLKGGGAYLRVPLLEEHTPAVRDDDSLLALDQALARLGELDPRALSVVELKFYCGFTNQETACVLSTSDSTVEEDWQFARSWLFGELAGGGLHAGESRK
jgi:RNA polymerase sigma factor (TIGR02999 family)